MTKDKRKLTEKEIKRGEKYEKIRQGLLEEGYRETTLTVGVVKANIMVLAIALPIALVFIILFYMVNPIVDFWKINISLLIFPAYLIGIVAHELIHGLTWAYFCKTKWKAIGFGVIWKYLTPYCTCNEPLSYKAYITGGLMPTIILGLVPYIISLLIASEFLLFFSLLLIIGGGGDMYMVMIMRKYKNAIFVDHPYEVGCTAFERD